MIRFLVTLAICIASAPAFAQVVRIQGGEHDGFTRLVFQLPSGAEWSLDRLDDRSLRLGVSGQDLRFDSSRAFDLIGRERVANLTAATDPGALDISMNCACEAEAFLFRNVYLVVDFKDGDPALAQSNQPRPAPAPETDAETGAEPVSPSDVTLSGQALALDLSAVRFQGDLGIGPKKRPAALLPNVALSPQAVPQSDQSAKGAAEVSVAPSELYEIGETLAADLARAATQGLLEPSLSAAPDISRLPQNPRTTQSMTAANGLTEPAPPSQKHLVSGAQGTIALGVSACVPDKNLHISQWANDRTIGEVLAQQRRRLTGEFDKINEKAVTAHARALIHFGFGAEARAVLALAGDARDPVLDALSYLVDGEFSETNWLARQVSCSGEIAFWAALNGGLAQTDGGYDETAILRGFESLPHGLKSFLGPIFAKRVAALGKATLAKEILRRIERSMGGRTAVTALGSAEIEILQGNYDQARDTLDNLPPVPGPTAPAAIAAKVAVAQATNQPISDDMVQLTGAYASELKGSQRGPALWEAHLQTLLQNGAFAQGFAVLLDADQVEPARQVRMARVAFSRLVETGGDLDFMKFAIDPALRNVMPDDAALHLAMIQRFIDLGLPDIALSRLDEYDAPPGARDFKLARAQALLATSRPEEAEIGLVGLRGREVAVLRAEARRQMGDHDYARGLFEELGEAERATDQAWLSGDWQRLAGSEQGILAEVARMIDADMPVQDAPSLEFADYLTGSSSAARQTLAALLDATRITPEDAEIE